MTRALKEKHIFIELRGEKQSGISIEMKRSEIGHQASHLKICSKILTYHFVGVEVAISSAMRGFAADPVERASVGLEVAGVSRQAILKKKKCLTLTTFSTYSHKVKRH